jgi:pyrroline-5-carboxylate reductase
MTGPIVLVGCGKMGGALLSGWLGGSDGQGANPSDIHVVEPYEATANELKVATPELHVCARVDEIGSEVVPEVVIFAVKPQALGEMIQGYRGLVGPATVFLSIAAGKRISFFEEGLGEHAAVVRAMPNTPAAIGRGITVACANSHVSAPQKATCQALLEAVGEVDWVDDEGLMDPVTAVSGSGPAYVFLMIECLAAAGVAAGLDGALAARLARATVSGSGELARQADQVPAELRKNVTSPGGTTEAALGVLMGVNGLQSLMTKAVEAATARSRELAG